MDEPRIPARWAAEYVETRRRRVPRWFMPHDPMRGRQRGDEARRAALWAAHRELMERRLLWALRRAGVEPRG